MGILLTIYSIVLVLVSAFVVINIYHMSKYRLGFRGDKTRLAIVLYLIIVIAILAFSWLGAFSAYQPPSL